MTFEQYTQSAEWEERCQQHQDIPVFVLFLLIPLFEFLLSYNSLLEYAIEIQKSTNYLPVRLMCT